MQRLLDFPVRYGHKKQIAHVVPSQKKECYDILVDCECIATISKFEMKWVALSTTDLSQHDIDAIGKRIEEHHKRIGEHQ